VGFAVPGGDNYKPVVPLSNFAQTNALVGCTKKQNWLFLHKVKGWAKSMISSILGSGVMLGSSVILSI